MDKVKKKILREKSDLMDEILTLLPCRNAKKLTSFFGKHVQVRYFVHFR